MCGRQHRRWAGTPATALHAAAGRPLPRCVSGRWCCMSGLQRECGKGWQGMTARLITSSLPVVLPSQAVSDGTSLALPALRIVQPGAGAYNVPSTVGVKGDTAAAVSRGFARRAVPAAPLPSATTLSVRAGCLSAGPSLFNVLARLHALGP